MSSCCIFNDSAVKTLLVQASFYVQKFTFVIFYQAEVCFVIFYKADTGS